MVHSVHVRTQKANKNPFNMLRAWFANRMWTYKFMNRVHQHCDSIGLNYYFYTQFGDKRTWRKTDMDWNFAPDHIYDALRYGIMSRPRSKSVFDFDDHHKQGFVPACSKFGY